MIALLFLNPGFLFVAAALISVPIIIHLINRMRFKRIRWAAMEFLLKAQKRTRRRLIIEQLLLLALRCLLLALVGLLVSRFIGCGEGNQGGKPNLHIVLVDDTLSMRDHWKLNDGTKVNCFDVAKNDFLIKKIAKGLAQSKTNDQLIILPLSKIDDANFETKNYTFDRLNDAQSLKNLSQFVLEMQPSYLHINMVKGVKKAEEIMGKNSESRVTLHVISDLRQSDWSHPKGEGLTKQLLGVIEKSNDSKIRIIDTVHPTRSAAQAAPQARDNVGIVDFHPSSRIVGQKMPVRFTVKIQNFSGKQVDVNLVAHNEVTGKDMLDVNFNPINPIKLAPSNSTEVTFDYGDIRHGLFFSDIKQGESRFAHLSVRLANAQHQSLDNDGILEDNIRHAVVEVRDKVPILVIDGEGAKGREDSKDSFFLQRSLISVPGSSYQVVFGDELPGTGGVSMKALEQPDLNKYPTIFLLNVRELTPKQLGNLEKFVNDGGGVAFYMGPQVNAAYYNKSLYKDGKGVFPAPLKSTYFPAPNEPELPTKEDSDTYQLIIRDEKFPKGATPIFGAIFEEAKQREPLANLPIHRYFKVDRGLWRQEPGRVHELATLPNEGAALAFEGPVSEITRGEGVKAIRDNPELAKYIPHLIKRLGEIEEKVKVRPGPESKAYHLANQIEVLLQDKASNDPNSPIPDMNVFWDKSDPKIQTLKTQLTNLRENVNYGDPFIITHTFGKGKVVAIMSTIGKDWNEWAGGSAASVLFMPFVWEMQNYLSSPGADANLTVGTDLPLELDADQFQGKQLKLMRYFMKTENDKFAERKEIDKNFGKVDADNGKVFFNMTNNREPGLYVSELVDENTPEKGPLAIYAHAFNVDTNAEGKLERVGSEELDRELLSKSKTKDAIKLVTTSSPDELLVSKTNDFSESPWLFLILLLVLVAEQALAVHLSFHLKNTESDMTPAGTKV